MTAQNVKLEISPAPALKVRHASTIPHCKLVNETPIAVSGAPREPGLVTRNVQADAHTCFGPRGAALLGDEGPLWISDTGHHRLLGWKKLPHRDLLPADYLIGQSDFRAEEGRNAKKTVSASSLNVPTGICRCGQGMAVADAWNHRVLIWNSVPEDSHVPADIVLGQTDFLSNEANEGKQKASANSFHWPYGVAWMEGHLFVADSENRRVLIWNGLPDTHNQPADVVLGQKNFSTRDENAGGDPGAMSMRWPHGLAMWMGNLCVADAGNNRIMVWKGIPTANGADCDYVLGQESTTRVDHNLSLYWPRANSLNMPYAVTSKNEWLIVADTANSRLLGWHIDDLHTGADARALMAQRNFHEKGDNRWQPACADSLCWPYGIQSVNDKLVIADSGNNRVSIWELSV